MIDLLIESIFFGFGILSISKAFVTKQKSGTYNSIGFEKIDRTAIFLVRLTGIAYLIIYLTRLYVDYTGYNAGGVSDSVTVSRLTGPYWFAYWAYMLFYPISTQLLWIKKFRESRWIRFVLGLLFLFSYEKFVILITSFHRDYLFGDEISNLISAMALNWLLHALVFAIILTVVMFILEKRKTLYNKI